MELEEPMDVDATVDFGDLLEEGECEDEPHRISRKVIPSVVAVPQSRNVNKSGTFVTGLDIFSEESKKKLEERAKRFGLSKNIETTALKVAENLYESFGINDENIKDYKLNVIHMRGTEDMTTDDVFKYFETYAPASVEWISDVSCNVVWLDSASAARAIVGLSKKIIGIKKKPIKKLHSDNESEEESEDDNIVNGKNNKDSNSVHVKDIRCPLPTGIWRKGRNCQNSRSIFLRFATKSDKKSSHGEKISLKGILTTSRKRALRKSKSRERSPETKKESSANGIAAKNPWGSLSKNWGRADFVEDDYLPKVPISQPTSNIKERLGFRSHNRDIEEKVEDNSNVIELSDETESESSSDEENWCKRSKIPRMRMHADDEEQKMQKRKGKIREMVSQSTTTALNDEKDLRGRLVARRRLPRLPPPTKEDIQIIVTNPKAVRSNFSNIDVTEDEEDDDDIQIVETRDQGDDDQVEEEEEEEGEIVEESDNDSKVEYEDEEEEPEEEQEEQARSESEAESTESSCSEKEVRGPKGSVIKVVPRKPKLASTISTVWSRLNNSKVNRTESVSPDRESSRYSKRDLRHQLRKNDLRSRIGSHSIKSQLPLRIELRNDKYSGRHSDS